MDPKTYNGLEANWFEYHGLTHPITILPVAGQSVLLGNQAIQFRTSPLVPRVVIDKPLTTMRVIGYRNKCAAYAKGKLYYDAPFVERHPELLESQYSWGFPTVEDVNTSMLRFDAVKEPKLLKKPFKHAMRLFLEMHESLRDSCVVLPGEEVELRSDSAPGPNYEHDCRSYGDVVNNYADEFHSLWNDGYLTRHVYWKAAGKVDVLKKSKVLAHDFRTFIFSDAPFRWFSARLYQDFNNKSHLKVPWIYIGFNRAQGGFSKLGAELHKWHRKLTCDAVKWDSGLIRIFFWIEHCLIWACLKPYYRTRETWERMLFALDERMNSIVILPSGETIFKEHGNNSGDIRTSDLNSLAHLFIMIYGAVLFLLDSGYEITLDSLYRHFQYALYGDDNVGGVSDEVDCWYLGVGGAQVFYTSLYECFGIVTHPDKFKYSPDLTGMVFLGGIFIPTIHGWGHGFDSHKLLYSMTCSDKEMSRIEFWEKWRSLLTLLAFDDSRHVIKNHMLTMKALWLEDLSERNPDFYIPSDQDLMSFWFGWESTPNCLLILPLLN